MSIGRRNVAFATVGGIPKNIIIGRITNDPPLAAEFKKPQITPKMKRLMIINTSHVF